jgi:hypothetical protein
VVQQRGQRSPGPRLVDVAGTNVLWHVERHRCRSSKRGEIGSEPLRSIACVHGMRALKHSRKCTRAPTHTACRYRMWHNEAYKCAVPCPLGSASFKLVGQGHCGRLEYCCGAAGKPRPLAVPTMAYFCGGRRELARSPRQRRGFNRRLFLGREPAGSEISSYHPERAVEAYLLSAHVWP